MDTLLIDGFYLEKGKLLKENVCEHLAYYVDFKLDPTEIKFVSHFGSTPDGGPSRSLKLRFHNPGMKNQLMAVKGQPKKTDVYFREHLMPHQLDIYLQAKIA